MPNSRRARRSPPVSSFLRRGRRERSRQGRNRAFDYFASASHRSIFSGVMNESIFLLLTSMTGASPQAPKHSPSFSVKRPSAVVSFQSMPSFFFRCCAASSAPESAHGRLVQMHSLCFPTGLRRSEERRVGKEWWALGAGGGCNKDNERSG